MARTMMGLVLAVVAAVGLGGCAGSGGRQAQEQEWMPTYVMVFTVTESAFTRMHPNCSGNCVPVRYNIEENVFKVMDADFGDKRKLTQVMYSPQWHQPDIKIAQRWARCVVEEFDKKTGDAKPDITSAYLFQIRVPVKTGISLQAATLGDDPCKWQPHKF